MSDIKFTCPQCKQSLEVPYDLAGEQIECTHCEADIQIPRIDEYLEKALTELDESRQDKSLWAKALVETDGDEAKARARYIEEKCNQFVYEEINRQGGGGRENKVPKVTDDDKVRWVKNPQDDPLKNDAADSPAMDERKTTGTEDTGIEKTKKNPQGLITCGYIFAFMGGVLGMGLGIVLLINQRKYTPNAKLHGVIILILGLFFMTFWKMASGLQ